VTEGRRRGRSRGNGGREEQKGGGREPHQVFDTAFWGPQWGRPLNGGRPPTPLRTAHETESLCGSQMEVTAWEVKSRVWCLLSISNYKVPQESQKLNSLIHPSHVNIFLSYCMVSLVSLSPCRPYLHSNFYKALMAGSYCQS